MNRCNGNVRAPGRDLLLKWGRPLGFLALLTALAYSGLCDYASRRKQHLARQTADFAARGDFQSAVLVARRLLELDENNLAACRVMAETAEKSDRAEAVLWRRKVVQAEPTLVADQLALARSALGFGQYGLAEAVLNSLPESERQSAGYHQIAGAEALARKDIAAAEEHFAIASQLAPADPQLAFNLAALRLTSSDAEVAQQGRARLIRLAGQAPLRLASLRALTAGALAHGDRTNAAHWAAQLKAEAGALFGDALLYFQAVEGTEAAPAALAGVQAKAIDSPATTAEFITWLNRHGQAHTAVFWSRSLPQKIANAHPVPLAIAESLSFLEDWNALLESVQGKDWNEHENLRLAVQAHALHRLSPPDCPSRETQTVWRAALKAAQTKPEQLMAIAQLAGGWGYQPEAEEAWWMIAHSNANARAALSALQRLYKQEQDTRGLLRVARRAVELNPSDLIATNNCASLGLLVSADSTSRRLAAKLHEEHPTNRAFTATHAYALHTEGKLTEGLEVLEKLQEEELRYPAIAAYYVVMLVDNGKLDRARSFLVEANRAVLLPEEQQLLTAAKRKLFASDTDAAANAAPSG